MQEFYILQFRNRRGVLHLRAQEQYNDIKLASAEIIPAQPFKASVEKGTTYHAYAYLLDPFNIAISEKLHQFLIQNNISGWRSFQ